MSLHYPRSPHPLRGYALAAAACGLAVLVAKPLTAWLDQANIVMLFLLVVFLLALRLGKGPALLAAFLCVALFDFFFVPPHLSFAVEDAQYLVTFAVMLAVALITGQMVARLHAQAEEVRQRETRTRALYDMARDLAGVLLPSQVAEILRAFLRGAMKADACLFLPDADGHLQAMETDSITLPDSTLPRRAFQREEPLELLGATGRGEAVLYLPLKAPMRTRGVLEVAMDAETLHRERPLLDTVASLAALTLERLHYVEVAQATEVRMASERLRASILSSLSHDLRTPLTALVGLADTLALPADMPEQHRETARALRDQALRLSGMVTNLLDLARLSAGGVTPRKDWHSLEEVIGSAIQWLGAALDAHPIAVELPADMPLLEFDPLLLERVLGNLLDNAAKYSPPGRPITIAARLLGAARGSGGARRRPRLPAPRGPHRSLQPGRDGIGPARRRPGPGHLQGDRGSPRRRADPGQPAGGRRPRPLHPAPGQPARHRRRNMNTVLIVEDEPHIRRFVRMALEGEGCRVLEADRVNGGLERAAAEKPDLVVLDLGLPDGDGLEFIRAYRAWSERPLVVLSARSLEADKVAALDAGADDYIAKPFGVAELLARVRALLRRREQRGEPAEAVIAFGDVELDLARRGVTRGGQPVRLTPREYHLLTTLVAQRGRVLTQRQLLAEVWGPGYAGHGHYLRIYVGRLRHKLEADPARPRHLLTELGVGYRFEA
jgi:two-component system sensor histidine kinase KdpD